MTSLLAAASARRQGSRMRRCSAALVAVLLASAGSAWAQAVKGTLLGTVNDTQGAAVPGATVTVTETGTNIARTAATNASGHYVFANLKDGIYRVEAEMTGFRRSQRDGVDGGRQHHRARGRDPAGRAAMRGGDRGRAETPPLQTDRADTGRIIESKQITEIPLVLQPQLPGAAGHGARGHPALPSALAVLQLAGQPVHQGQRPVAPGQQRDARRHRQQPQDGPPHRAHPVRGRHRGGQRQHQQLRRGVRARGRRGHQRHPEVRHQPAQGRRLLLRQRRQHAGQELLLGHRRRTRATSSSGPPWAGPIVKDKLFFFADYQGTRDNLGNVFRHNIPPADFRNGDFSRATTIIYDPATGQPGRHGPAALPRATSSPPTASARSPATLLAFLPAPNVAARPRPEQLRVPEQRGRRRRRPPTSS